MCGGCSDLIVHNLIHNVLFWGRVKRYIHMMPEDDIMQILKPLYYNTEEDLLTPTQSLQTKQK